MKKASGHSSFAIEKIRETNDPVLKPGDPQFEANKVRAAELSSAIMAGPEALQKLKEKLEEK